MAKESYPGQKRASWLQTTQFSMFHRSFKAIELEGIKYLDRCVAVHLRRCQAISLPLAASIGMQLQNI